jgi:hypothetical protein
MLLCVSHFRSWFTPRTRPLIISTSWRPTWTQGHHAVRGWVTCKLELWPTLKNQHQIFPLKKQQKYSHNPNLSIFNNKIWLKSCHLLCCNLNTLQIRKRSIFSHQIALYFSCCKSKSIYSTNYGPFLSHSTFHPLSTALHKCLPIETSPLGMWAMCRIPVNTHAQWAFFAIGVRLFFRHVSTRGGFDFSSAVTGARATWT